MAPMIMVETLSPPAGDAPGTLALTVTLSDGSIWRAVAPSCRKGRKLELTLLE